MPLSPSLKILTLNVHKLPFDVMGPTWPWFRLSTWRERYANEFDLICFQELFEEGQRRTFLHTLQPNFKHVSRGGRWSGLAIASRFKLSHTGFIPFAKSSGSDALARKGVQHALVHLPNGPVWVLNTHLQSGRQQTQHALRQAHQVPPIIALVETLLKHWRCPVMLVGDFNLDESSIEYYELNRLLEEHLGLQDISRGLYTAGALTSSENRVSKFRERELLKLDYIWTSKELLPHTMSVRSRPFPLAPCWYASDHSGVEAFFLFT